MPKTGEIGSGFRSHKEALIRKGQIRRNTLRPPHVITASAFSVFENVPLTISLLANEPVTWALMGADASEFDPIVGSTLTFPPHDYENPEDAGADNVYNCAVITTSILTGLQTIHNIAVTVLDVAENPITLPVLADYTMRRGAKTRNQGGGVILTPLVHTSGSAPDSYTITGLPANWTYDGASGRIYPTIDNPAAGTWPLEVTASNAAGTSSPATVTLNVVANVCTISDQLDVSGGPYPLRGWGGTGSPNLRGVRVEVARNTLEGMAFTFRGFIDPANSNLWMTIGNEDDAHPAKLGLFTVRGFKKLILDKLLTVYDHPLPDNLNNVGVNYNIYFDSNDPTGEELVIDGCVSRPATLAEPRKYNGSFAIKGSNVEVKNCDLTGYDGFRLTQIDGLWLHHNILRRFTANQIFSSMKANWLIEKNILMGCADNGNAGEHHDNWQHGVSNYPYATSGPGVFRWNVILPGAGDILKGQGVFHNDISYNGQGSGAGIGNGQFLTGSTVNDVATYGNFVLTGVANGLICAEIGTGWVVKNNVVVLPPAALRPPTTTAYPTIRASAVTETISGTQRGAVGTYQDNVTHDTSINTLPGTVNSGNIEIGNIEPPWVDWVVNPTLSANWDTDSYATIWAEIETKWRAKGTSPYKDIWPLDTSGNWRELASAPIAPPVMTVHTTLGDSWVEDNQMVLSRTGSTTATDSWTLNLAGNMGATFYSTPAQSGVTANGIIRAGYGGQTSQTIYGFWNTIVTNEAARGNNSLITLFGRNNVGSDGQIATIKQAMSDVIGKMDPTNKRIALMVPSMGGSLDSSVADWVRGARLKVEMWRDFPRYTWNHKQYWWGMLPNGSDNSSQDNADVTNDKLLLSKRTSAGADQQHPNYLAMPFMSGMAQPLVTAFWNKGVYIRDRTIVNVPYDMAAGQTIDIWFDGYVTACSIATDDATLPGCFTVAMKPGSNSEAVLTRTAVSSGNLPRILNFTIKADGYDDAGAAKTYTGRYRILPSLIGASNQTAQGATFPRDPNATAGARRFPVIRWSSSPFSNGGKFTLVMGIAPSENSTNLNLYVQGSDVVINRSSGNKIAIVIKDSAGTTVLNWTTLVTDFNIAGGLTWLMVAVDLTVPVAKAWSGRNASDVDIKAASAAIAGNGLINLAASAPNVFCSGSTPTASFVGKSMYVWVDDRYIDPDVSGNRRKFWNTDGTPVNLGANGSVDSVQPKIYLPFTPGDVVTGRNAGSAPAYGWKDTWLNGESTSSDPTPY